MHREFEVVWERTLVAWWKNATDRRYSWSNVRSWLHGAEMYALANDDGANEFDDVSMLYHIACRYELEEHERDMAEAGI